MYRSMSGQYARLDVRVPLTVLQQSSCSFLVDLCSVKVTAAPYSKCLLSFLTHAQL